MQYAQHFNIVYAFVHISFNQWIIAKMNFVDSIKDISTYIGESEHGCFVK